MFLLEVEASDSNTVEKELEGSNLQIDPRPIIIPYIYELYTFQITYEEHASGKIVATIIKSGDDDSDDDGWEDDLFFRVYDPAKEVVPSFTSTTYTYHGIENERAPWDTIRVIIDKLVKVIRKEAFYNCHDMKVCEMHDGVEEIRDEAFHDCCSLKNIVLSKI